MKIKNNIVVSTIATFVLFALLVGATYAFFEQGGIGKNVDEDIDVVSTTTDHFSFRVGNDISFKVAEADFVQNGTSRYGETTVTVVLTPNNDTGTATREYKIGLYLTDNNFVYSLANTTHQPELLLQVFDSNDNSIELDGVGERVNNGYDITGKTGLLVLSTRTLTANNNQMASESFRVRITFVNLDVSQNDNVFKSVLGKVYVIQGKPSYCHFYPEDCSPIAITNLSKTYGRTGSISCTNATATYNNSYNQIEISGISANIPSCTLTFTDVQNKQYLNNYIISLENDANQGDGTVVHETVDSFTTVDGLTTTEAGYRYEGDNPNNYVWFNNELWRIIGVFGPESHGQEGKQLVKIIREDSIGGLVWNINNTNNWNASSLKTILNGAYYNHTTDTENCYGYYDSSTQVPTTCDYIEEGIQSGYQSMVENVTWYLGGGGKSGYTTYTAPMEYQYERQGIVYSKNIPNSGEGKIGLMYLSDYAYGVKASDCTRTINVTSYNTDICGGKNWLYKGNYEWTISPDTYSTNYVWNLNSIGGVISDEANIGYGIRPVLYLSSSVYKVSGSGTQTDPYIIGM